MNSPSKQYLRDRKFRRRMGNDVRRCALAESLATPCFRKQGTKQLPRPFHTSCSVQLKVHFALSCQMPSRSNRVPVLSGSCSRHRGDRLARYGSQTFDVKPRKRSRVECKRPTAESEIFLIELRRHWTGVHDIRFRENFHFCLLETTFFSLIVGRQQSFSGRTIVAWTVKSH